MGRHRILFVLLILSWSISWPAIKVGVATVPPIWYACFRYVIATILPVHICRRAARGGVSATIGLAAGRGLGGSPDGGVFGPDRQLALTILPQGERPCLRFRRRSGSSRSRPGGCDERASAAALFGVATWATRRSADDRSASCPRGRRKADRSRMPCS